jgi:hypothetical protein
MSDRVAILLVDLDGYGDTRLLAVQNGVVIPLEGLPVLNPGGEATLNPALTELDMTDSQSLGAFIRWSRQLYPAQQTLFSFVGHGAALTPQIAPLLALDIPGVTPTPQPTPPVTQINPLPPRIPAHSDLTDYHSASLISIKSLAKALAIGTQEGQAPLSLVDLLHCFSATIEELYELQPYAATFTAAPNYIYAQPQMLGAGLVALRPAQSPRQMAATLIARYDETLPAEDHPRLFVAVDSQQLPAIKNAWDETADQLMQALAAEGEQTRQRIGKAYRQSAKYDTTVCDPQDWQLAPPDALSDLADLAGQLRGQFGVDSPVGAAALTTTQAISQAVIARAYHNGAPWFANILPPPFWHFDAPGIAIFSDFSPKDEGGVLRFSWQAKWYTSTMLSGNPYPLRFLLPGGNLSGGNASGQRASWADLFASYWSQPIANTIDCLPGFVTGRGAGELTLQALTPLPSSNGLTFSFAVTVYAEQTATNPLLRLRVYRETQHGEERNVERSAEFIYEDVSGVGYLPAGDKRTLATRLPWSPPTTGVYLIEAMIDADNRFAEANESDNMLAITVSVTLQQSHLPWINNR